MTHTSAWEGAPKVRVGVKVKAAVLSELLPLEAEPPGSQWAELGLLAQGSTSSPGSAATLIFSRRRPLA